MGIHSLPSVPRTRSLNQVAADPLGVLRTRSAAPAHTKDMASVTTMSGTLVTTTSAPLMAPSRSPCRSTRRTTRTANSSLFPFMSAAAVTLVSAIIEPTDRSMPPAMTTIAWATAARATGSAGLGE